MKKREILLKNSMFRLVRQQRDHKTWYEIQIVAGWFDVSDSTEYEIAKYFGTPLHVEKRSWRIWNREEAHRHFTFVTLRFC